MYRFCGRLNLMRSKRVLSLSTPNEKQPAGLSRRAVAFSSSTGKAEDHSSSPSSVDSAATGAAVSPHTETETASVSSSCLAGVGTSV